MIRTEIIEQIKIGDEWFKIGPDTWKWIKIKAYPRRLLVRPYGDKNFNLK